MKSLGAVESRERQEDLNFKAAVIVFVVVVVSVVPVVVVAVLVAFVDDRFRGRARPL